MQDPIKVLITKQSVIQGQFLLLMRQRLKNILRSFVKLLLDFFVSYF